MKKINIQYAAVYNPDVPDKAFDKVSHRLFFVVDLPCENALRYYMHITRQTALAAVAALSNIPDAEIEWIRDYVARSINFRYKISVDEKLEYIKELERYYGSNRLQV